MATEQIIKELDIAIDAKMSYIVNGKCSTIEEYHAATKTVKEFAVIRDRIVEAMKMEDEDDQD